MLLNYWNDKNRVFTSLLIEGNELKLLRGLNSLKVLNEETLDT